jgi:hypothetical protein
LTFGASLHAFAPLADLLDSIAQEDKDPMTVGTAASLVVAVVAAALRCVPESTPVQHVLDALLRAFPVGMATKAELERLSRKVNAADAHPWLRGRADRLASTLDKLAYEVKMLAVRAKDKRRKDERRVARLRDVVSTAFPDKSEQLVSYLLPSHRRISAERVIIADLWPEEDEEELREPSPLLRNRLHQLQSKTNSKLVPLEWKISRPAPRLLLLHTL